MCATNVARLKSELTPLVIPIYDVLDRCVASANFEFVCGLSQIEDLSADDNDFIFQVTLIKFTWCYSHGIRDFFDL